MPRHNAELTPKEKRFVTEFLVDGNATRSAIAAGYSKASAHRIGYEIQQKLHVKAAITSALREQEKRTLVKADRNLVGIERLAEKAEGIGEFGAAIRARELIGKHYGSFTDRIEVRDTTPRADRLAAARARRRKDAAE